MLIGLTGYAGSGKDTAAAYLVENHGFERRAFADKLRELVYASNPRVYTVGERVQTIVDRHGWEAAKRSHPSIRELLQEAGQAHRDVFGEDFWVDQVLPDYPGATSIRGKRIVITDVRYANEARRIRMLGGIVVRVDRPGTGPVNAHESERELAADRTVLNVDGHLGHTHHSLKELVSTLEGK